MRTFRSAGAKSCMYCSGFGRIISTREILSLTKMACRCFLQIACISIDLFTLQKDTEHKGSEDSDSEKYAAKGDPRSCTRSLSILQPSVDCMAVVSDAFKGLQKVMVISW